MRYAWKTTTTAVPRLASWLWSLLEGPSSIYLFTILMNGSSSLLETGYLSAKKGYAADVATAFVDKVGGAALGPRLMSGRAPHYVRGIYIWEGGMGGR